MEAKILHFPKVEATTSTQLFENLSELLTPEQVAEALQTTKGTVYQWSSRPKRYGIPDGMFVKMGRKLLIRREVMKTWVLSRVS